MKPPLSMTKHIRDDRCVTPVKTNKDGGKDGEKKARNFVTSEN
jgi:hypothetical protein